METDIMQIMSKTLLWQYLHALFENIKLGCAEIDSLWNNIVLKTKCGFKATNTLIFVRD